MLALFRQFAARTESSISFTLMFRSFFSRVFSWFTSSGVSSKFRFKFLLLVDRASYLVGIQHFDPLDRLNIPGRNLALFVDFNCYRARFVVDRFKFYLL